MLCEQTVKQVLPQLTTNRDKLEELIETGKDQITKKGEEILKYKEEHNIRIAGQAGSEGGGPAGAGEDKPNDTGSNRNILVVNN